MGLKTLFTVSLLLLLTNYTAKAQVTTQQQVWHSLDVSAKMASKTRVGVQVHERYFVAPVAQNHLVLKANVYQDLKHQWAVFGGYTYFLLSPQDPNLNANLRIPEQRLQQGFTHRQSMGKIGVLQRYQIEERFLRNVDKGALAEGHRFIVRFRYRLLVDFKLREKETTTPKGDLVFRIGNEVHLSAGKSIKGQPFDQNRAMAVLQYFVNDQIRVDVGYTHWYQQRNANQGFFNRHILTTGMQVRFDCTQKPKKPKDIQ